MQEDVKFKILWDFAMQTDKEIPGIVLEEKRECKIIDIAVPGDQKIKVK